MKQRPSFFIVWCPNGTTPPSQTHETRVKAKREAERLATVAWPQEFFVMKAVSVSRKVMTITDDLDEDEIPF